MSAEISSYHGFYHSSLKLRRAPKKKPQFGRLLNEKKNGNDNTTPSYKRKIKCSIMVLPPTIHTSPSMADSKCLVEVESVLRIRPCSKSERTDAMILEPVQSIKRNAPASVVLHPFHNATLGSPISGSSLRSRADSETSAHTMPQEFHFNHVLPENTSQDKIYYALGLPIATSSMESLKAATQGFCAQPKSHVMICLGVINSGKTYTCFGGTSIPKRRASQDGLVPRLVDSLFSQSKHHADSSKGSKGFAVNISMMQVSQSKGSDPHACQVHDLLASPSPKNNKATSASDKRSVMAMARNFERTVLPSPVRSPVKGEVVEMDVDDLQPAIKSCRDVTQAREILQSGLSASKKAAKGQHNHHLLITIQPVLNDTHFGDKIAILDMAGLEKCGKRSNNRGKDSVPNQSQAANAAVLHCLRTLMQNTNIQCGKSDALDIVCHDDLVSEISNISEQEKKQLKNRLKPVPFRQHKLTMLLQPIFMSCATAKVTLLLAAYPGHADYYEKKALLQDMELLCGTALLQTKATVDTGMMRGDSESLSLVQSTFDEDDDEESVDQNLVYLKNVPSASTRQVNDRKSSGNSLALSVSFDNDDEKMVPMPPAYAPHKSSEPIALPMKSKARPSAPSGTALLDACAPKHPTQNTKNVSDFPGVTLLSRTKCKSPTSDQMNGATVIPSSITGGPQSRGPPSPEEENRDYKVTFSGNPNIRSPRHPRESMSPDYDKVPLGRSAIENSDFPEKQPSTWKSTMRTLQNVTHTGKQVISAVKDRALSPPRTRETSPSVVGESKYKESLPEFSLQQTETRSVSTTQAVVEIRQRSEDFLSPKASHSSRKRKEEEFNRNQPVSNKHHHSESCEAQEKIRELETAMQQILSEKRSLEDRFHQLERENKDLKQSVREAERKIPSSKWTDKDEEEFQKERRLRIEDQKLVQQPLFDHIRSVDRIYDIKNQWCMTNKPHFSLYFPSNFQRAPALDVRDKAEEEEATARAASMGGSSETKPKTRSKITPVKLTFDSENCKQNKAGERKSTYSMLQKWCENQKATCSKKTYG